MPQQICEIALPYSGDITILANGDIKLSIDTQDNPQASIERITRLVCSCPCFKDTGFPLTRPDDLCHTEWGAGVRALVDELITDDLINTIKRNVMQSLAADPFISDNPQPVVSVYQGDIQSIAVVIQCNTIFGLAVTTPQIPLTPQGA